MKNISIGMIPIFLIFFLQSCPSEPRVREPFTAPPPSTSEDTWSAPDGFTLAWSDEFDGPDIDLSNWSYETQATGWSPSWNGEWQRYTDNGTGDRNASINDGVLVIKAIETSGGDGGYTSARMVTKWKHSWKYGIIAARMQMPYGQGMWPALWMMGVSGGWPACGEIDILEMIGGGTDGINDRIVHSAMHWDDGGHETNGDDHEHNEKLADDWHYYECVWEEDSVTMRFDGTPVFSQSITAQETSEFHQPFYILLNLAVGGFWPGPPDETTVFPQYLYVDWIRVYQPE
ncbi:MAG: glycoside hydrolase family 16 protein [Spirochaetales bacterium]|nr:glycoside hydrolase family 16 protein [Spirochaetales bacterium]